MRRRVLIARLGLVAAAMVVVWLLVSARLDASQARREQAAQARAAAASSAELRAQLQAANKDRDDLGTQLAAVRAEAAGIRTSVRELPGRLPRSTSTTTRVLTVPGPPRVIRGPRGPVGPRGPANASAAPSRPPSPPSGVPAPPRSCLIRAAGVGVCGER